MRDWKKFGNDEITTIWKGYLHTEFPFYENSLNVRPEHFKPNSIRLTPMEIIKLVEELMERLEMKISE